MYAVVIDGVSEAHGFPPGGNLIDRDFLIHTLGFLEEEIVSNTRLPYDPNESSGRGFRRLICELEDEDEVAYWTENGKGRVVQGYTIHKYVCPQELAESLLDLEDMKVQLKESIVQKITAIHDNARFSKEGQHLFWQFKRKSIPLAALDDPSSFLIKLGEGSFGAVYLYEDKYSKIAVKQIKMPLTLVQQEGTDVMQEVELHKTLYHPNIIRYFGCHQAKNNICIMMEHAQLGSLKQVLLKAEDRGETLSRLPYKQIMSFSRQILKGLNYLHTRQKPIIHRDLRAVNVLIDSNRTAKIADFGISKQLNTMASTSGFDTDVGNIYWKSPELIKSERVGRKVDIWSLGVTILEMIYVKPPFFKLEGCQWMYRLTRNQAKPPEIPTFVDRRLQHLVTYCLAYDADNRKSAEWLLQWLQWL